MAAIEIRLFGSPCINSGNGCEADLRSAKAIALLAYLAVESEQVHRRQKLVGLLWPGFTESSARANLRRALADLRQAIGERYATKPLLLVTPETIRFNPASDAWVDVAIFTKLLGALSSTSAFERVDATGDLAAIEKAARLYCAPFMDGFSIPDSAAYEEWITITRERCHRLALKAFYYLADFYQGRDEIERALTYAWRQLELDPWQESAHRQVMQLLALSGQRAAALAQYETCRRLLQNELGVEPSPQSRQLVELIRSEQWPGTFAEKTELSLRIARPTGSCPYRGLAAFREQDSQFFFGRQQITERLLEAVKQDAVPKVLIGASGSGKSSLVFAGLLPELRLEDGWLVAHLRPGAQPFHALAAALVRRLEPQLGETECLLQAHKLAEALLNQEIRLADIVERTLATNPPAERLLLFIDQFEELYTLCSEASTRQRFLAEILTPGKEYPVAGWSPLKPLLALRADFIGQALAYRPFAEVLQQGTLLLGSMNQDELRQAIEKPAEKQGAAFEPGLVERILDDLGDEPGNLPLLEFALTQLWELQHEGWFTHSAYENIGQVKGALARYAEQVFSQLDPSEQAGICQVFIQLVRPGEGTEDTRRTATRAEIGEGNWPLVHLLADQRLVVTGHEPGSAAETVELIHEALIQSWERLRGWIEADRTFRAWQEDLRAALHRWEKGDRDDSLLLRGLPLAQAEVWCVERQVEIGPAEAEFIHASQQLRQQRETEHEQQRNKELAAERRTHRLLGGLVTVLTIAVIIALALTTYSLRQGRLTLEAYSLSLAAHAQKALEDLDSASALALALEANRIPDPPHPVQRALLAAAAAPGAHWRENAAALFPEESGPLTVLAISPDSKQALIASGDGTIILWEIGTREEIHCLEGHTGRVNSLAFSSEGALALSGGEDHQVILWNLATGNEIRRFTGHTGSVRAIDFSPNGRTIVSGGFRGTEMLTPGELILWDTQTGREKQRLEGHIAGIVAAKFAPDGDHILASSGDAEIFADRLTDETLEPGQVPFDLILWDIRSGRPVQQFSGYNEDTFALAISPDGKTALTGSFYNKVAVLWSLESGTKISSLEGHTEGIHAIAFSPDGRRALTASYDDSLIFWDLDSDEPIAYFNVHQADVLSLAISPDGRFALSGDRQGELIYWELTDAAEVQHLNGHGDMVYDVALTEDGRYALSSSGSAAPSLPVLDASIRWWDLASGQQLRSAEIPVNVIFQIAISPDGRLALLATDNPAVILWDLVAWQEIGRLEGHPAAVVAVEFAPDGRRALSLSVDGTMILWDIPHKTAISFFTVQGQGSWSLAIAPDGRTALSDSGNSSMLLWNLETGQQIRSFQRDDSTADHGSSGMAFSPNSRTAINCDQDGFLIEWDLNSGREIRRLGQHASLRTRVAISPDGTLAITSGMDGVIKIWDMENGELVRQSGGHGVIFDLSLAPDGETAFFGSSDRVITQWRLDAPSLDELRSWIEVNRYVRDLTCVERSNFRIETDQNGEVCAP